MKSIKRVPLPKMCAQKHESKRSLAQDARSDSEFDVSHLEGALRVRHDLREEVETAVRKSEEEEFDAIVCYCSIGYRSCALAEKLGKSATFFSSKKTVLNFMLLKRLKVVTFKGDFSNRQEKG